LIENDLFFREYVVHYTNASCILNDEYRDPEDNEDGYFSGWNEEKRAYEGESWLYKGGDLSRPERDLTLQHPQCVFQKLKRHFSRYTPEMVEKICGIPPELFHKVADALVGASGPERTAAVCYAVGWTQHSKGVQIIRTAAILQLLLGNIGRPGGGILALRGHASIQGSTDIPTLYDILPGYLKMPQKGDETIEQYLEKYGKKTGLWANYPKYLVSTLKAYYGKRATAQNDFGYGWLPKLTGNHSFFEFLYDMLDEKMEGMFLMGQNPAVGAPNSRLQRRALSKLKWLVVRDMVEIESANFWCPDAAAPEVERGELKPEDIETEIFFFPAAGHAEKEGAFTNTQRLLQWREKAVNPPGDCRSDAWFVHQLALRLIAKANASDDPMDEPLRALDWWYPEDELGEPKMEAVLAEINGWHTLEGKENVQPASALDGLRHGERSRSNAQLPTEDDGSADGVVFGADRNGNPHHGAQINGFAELKSDGSTACGCWIYSGVFGRDGVNKADSRKSRDYLGHGWGFAWPSDRRIIYNRASARPDGSPWSERKKLVWWDSEKWTGIDVAGFVQGKPPDYEPEVGAEGLDAIPGDAPFILHEDGLGWLYVPKGLKDGPFPTHYEPLESPVSNELYSHDTNPPEHWFPRVGNRFSPPGDARFPCVLTTYRLTEHHTAGGMSRFLSHLAELQPEMFAEISPELARQLKIRNGDYVCVVTLRGAIEARALVSRRIRVLGINGKIVHQVALPYHYGTAGLVRGGAANDLLTISGEPNVTIMESKACTCNIVPGRLPRGRALADFLDKYAAQPGSTSLHPEEPPPGKSTSGGGHATEGKE
jgi:formate dehydrogenase major subunit